MVASPNNELPEFPEFRAIRLSDRETIETAIRREQPVVSELSFANAYLWRAKYGTLVAKIDGGIALLMHDDNGLPFALPPVGVNQPDVVTQRMIQYLSQKTDDPHIYGVSLQMVQLLDSNLYTSELDRDNADYVYTSESLIDLPGRRLHRKRNHIAQFRTKYNCEYRRVTPDLVEDCRKLQRTWCDVRDCFIPENRSLASEHCTVMEALNQLEPLGLLAGAVIIDESVAAFGIGGELNDDTVVIHFEKANPAYPGLYQVINQEFCADIAANYKYVNREQDLGDPGLRKAKESYYPDHLIDKYVVRPAK